MITELQRLHQVHNRVRNQRFDPRLHLSRVFSPHITEASPVNTTTHLHECVQSPAQQAHQCEKLLAHAPQNSVVNHITSQAWCGIALVRGMSSRHPMHVRVSLKHGFSTSQTLFRYFIRKH